MISPELPAARIVLALVLVGLLGVLVWRAVRKDRREYRGFTRFRSSAKRRGMYRKWLLDSFGVFGSASVIVLLLVWQYVPLLRADVDEWGWVRGIRSAFESSAPIGGIVAVALSVVLLGGSVLAIVLARKVEAIPAIGDIHALLPRNRAELRWGAALSVNAGVVEELLFRLALPALLYGVTSSAVASIVGSLLVFGALHVYQGAAGVVGSTVIGALLMTVYFGTGSIVIAILLHAFIDLRSLVLIPVIVQGVHRRPADYAPPRTPRVARSPHAPLDEPAAEASTEIPPL